MSQIVKFLVYPSSVENNFHNSMYADVTTTNTNLRLTNQPQKINKNVVA